MLSRCVEVREDSGVGAARRMSAELAHSIGFDQHAIGRVSLAATEIATNLLKYGARAQRVVVNTIERNGRASIDVLGIDAGPGITNAAEALRDGYSSTGTSGTGLGAVRRAASEFELYSRPDGGTIVLARIFADDESSRSATDTIALGVLTTPIDGEDVSGDACGVLRTPDRTWIIVADGLGHGADAALASTAAIRAFHDAAPGSPAALLRSVHEAIAHTRGAAVAIAEIRADAGELAFAGVGNIAGAIVTASDRRNLISHDGITGHVAPRIQEFTHPLPADALLVMHSDGVSQRWTFDGYPGLYVRDPAIIAAALHRDCSRGRDDAAIIVVRHRRTQSRTASDT